MSRGSHRGPGNAAATITVTVAAAAILLFIVYLPGVPNGPLRDLRHAAMVHDVLVTTGMFSIMGLVADGRWTRSS